MKYFDLKKIDKFSFGVEDIANVLGISLPSARVAASRYAKQGLLLRIKKNMYVTRENWAASGKAERFKLANLCQVPSYISLMSALDHFEVTTQMQRDIVESVAIRRSREITVNGSVFRYVKIATGLYHTFQRSGEVFIASPEKALLDAMYLLSYGRYNFDLASIDKDRFDPAEIDRLAQMFPARTRKLMERYGYLQKT